MPLDRVSGQFFEVSVGDSGGRRATAICAVLGIARRSAYYVARGHLAGRYQRADDGRVMPLHGLMLAPRVHRRHGRPHLGQIPQPASNQRWCSDVFLIPCRSGEVVSVAFAIDCHDREVPAYVASPRPLTGDDVRTLMDRTLSPRPRTARSRFRANEVRLLLGVIAYNLGNLLRRLAFPLTIQSWSLTSLQQWLFKTGVTTLRTG